MARLLVLHGPNLNLLGSREPEIYGTTTLAEIDAELMQRAREAGHRLDAFQSNAEHELIARIQNARADEVDFILMNPAAFTHTSVAMRDAIASVNIPFIEVHLSNPHAREPFRQQSYFTDLAVGTISGFGADSYKFALEAAIKRLPRHGVRTQRTGKLIDQDTLTGIKLIEVLDECNDFAGYAVLASDGGTRGSYETLSAARMAYDIARDSPEQRKAQGR